MSTKKVKLIALSLSVLLALLALAFVLGQKAIAVYATDEDERIDPVALAQDVEDHSDSLIEHMQTMIDLSHQEIENKANDYDAVVKTTARLDQKHITYGSRITCSSDKLVINNLSPSKNQVRTSTLDLRTPSSVTAYELDTAVLKSTGLKGLGADFVQAELDYGVNAMFLVSLAIHESGWGRSDIAKDKNNLFGFRAYDRSPYKSATTFSTKGASIRAAAKLVSGSYLSTSGPYYRGGFTAAHVNTVYASDAGWASKICTTMENIDQKIMNAQDTSYHQELYNIAKGENENGEIIYSKLFKAENQTN